MCAASPASAQPGPTQWSERASWPLQLARRGIVIGAKVVVLAVAGVGVLGGGGVSGLCPAGAPPGGATRQLQGPAGALALQGELAQGVVTGVLDHQGKCFGWGGKQGRRPFLLYRPDQRHGVPLRAVERQKCQDFPI